MIFRKSFILCLVALALLFPVRSFSQKGDAGTKNQSAKVKKCDTLYYYGVDLSHVRVTDGSKTDRSLNYSTVYPPAWIGYVEKELPPYKYVQPKLKNRVFYYVAEDVQKNTLKVVPSFIISEDYSFPADTVNKAVKSYSLSRHTGIGLVIIAENFNKNHESSSSWVTFFDIKTREVLWTVKVSGKCSHMGYTAHWGSGIVSGFKKFVSSVY